VMDDLAGKQTVPYLPLESLLHGEVPKPEPPAGGGGR
jgi:hypothetical protein